MVVLVGHDFMQGYGIKLLPQQEDFWTSIINREFRLQWKDSGLRSKLLSEVNRVKRTIDAVIDTGFGMPSIFQKSLDNFPKLLY